MPKCIKCKNDAYYGVVKNILTHCCIHKADNMIFLRGSMCKDKSCLKQASFGIPGQKVKFCATHKEPEMKNLRLNKCDKTRCKLRPCYSNTDKSFCFEHKVAGMICTNSSLALKQEVKYASIKAILKMD